MQQVQMPQPQQHLQLPWHQRRCSQEPPMAAGGWTEGPAMSLLCQAVVMGEVWRQPRLGPLVVCRRQGGLTPMIPRPQCPRPGLPQLPLWMTTTHLALASHQQR